MTSLQVVVEVHISTAFVKLTGKFRNPLADTVDCIFEAPMHPKGTVTSASVVVGNRMFNTMVVDPASVVQEVGEEGNNPMLRALKAYGSTDASKYNPEVFRLPFSGVSHLDEVTCTLEYMQDLHFHQGNYFLTVPMTIPEGMCATPRLGDIISIKTTINAGTEDCRWGSATHAMRMLLQEASHVVLESDPDAVWPNSDFTISYFAQSRGVLAHCIVEPPPVRPAHVPEAEFDARGSFMLFLSPPQPESGTKSLPRNIVFLLDRSASMSGRTMKNAIVALCAALDTLNDGDYFLICAYDHTQMWLSHTGTFAQVVEGQTAPPPIPATANTITDAQEWVKGLRVGGMTDILTPFAAAVDALKQVHEFEAGKGRLPHHPVIFLITDGAVANERAICKLLREEGGPVRCFTFGIGTFANRYFLKMLAQIGRGYSELCLYPDQLSSQILSLMLKTDMPVLSDITLGISGLQSCEIFPFPVPDLYCGAPVVLTGKFVGAFPASIELRGLQGNGRVLSSEVQAFYTQQIPVGKMFVKNRLDLLLASAWLAAPEESKALRALALQLSCHEGIPCPLTEMRAFLVDYERKAGATAAVPASASGSRLRSAAVGGHSVALGVSVAASAAYGSVLATHNNANVDNVMTSFLNGGWSDSFLSGLGDVFTSGRTEVAECDCSCCPGQFGEQLSSLFASHELALDNCFGHCGTCVDDVSENVCGAAGMCFENVWGCIADGGQICLNCVDSCTDMEPRTACTDLLSECVLNASICFTGACLPVSEMFTGITMSSTELCANCNADYHAFLIGCGGLLDGCAGNCVGLCGGCCDIMMSCCATAGVEGCVVCNVACDYLSGIFDRFF